MSNMRNETIVRRYYADALTHGDWQLLDTLIAVTFIEHEVLPHIAPTREGIKQKYDLLRMGFPDLRFGVEEIFSVAEKVAARVIVQGTHTGMFMGHPPTNRTFAVTSVNIFRIAQGQLVEYWGVFDQLSMLGQLGVFPGQPMSVLKYP